MRVAGYEKRVAVLPLALMAAMLVELLVRLYALRTLDPLDTIDFLFDDAYYYLGVARNFAAGAGSVFVQPLLTNGFQPLWMLLLAAAARVGTLSKIDLVTFAVVVTYLAHLGGLALCFFSKDRDLRYVGYGLFAAIYIFSDVFLRGLETTLLSLFVPFFYRLVRDLGQQRPALPTAVFFALLFLVRLDTLSLFAGFLAVAATLESGVKLPRVRAAALVGATCAVYFWVNFHFYGIPVPVSGIAKSIGNRVGENAAIGLNYVLTLRWPCELLVVTFLVGSLLRESRLPEQRAYLRAIACSLLALLLSFLYYGFLSGWRLWGWYFWPSALVTVFLGARLARLMRSVLDEGGWQRSSIAVRALLGACLLGVSLQFVRLTLADDGELYGAYRAASASSLPLRSFNKMNLTLQREFLSRQPPGVLVMGDRAGGLGYWLDDGFGFLHTEGLVASPEFARERAAGRGEQFIDRYAPKYLVVERERYLEAEEPPQGRIIGVAEPINGLSAHSGTMLFCFPQTAILYTRRYRLNEAEQTRYVFAYDRKIPCPASLRAQLSRLDAGYGALRRFSIPSEYGQLQRNLGLPF